MFPVLSQRFWVFLDVFLQGFTEQISRRASTQLPIVRLAAPERVKALDWTGSPITTDGHGQGWQLEANQQTLKNPYRLSHRYPGKVMFFGRPPTIHVAPVDHEKTSVISEETTQPESIMKVETGPLWFPLPRFQGSCLQEPCHLEASNKDGSWVGTPQTICPPISHQQEVTTKSINMVCRETSCKDGPLTPLAPKIYV